MSTNIGTIYINPYDIYSVQIIEKINAIIILEKVLSNLDSNKQEKIDLIKKAIDEKLEFIKYLFSDTNTNDFINMQLPIDETGKLVSYGSKNIDKYVNPLIVFVNNFKSNKIKYKIIHDWIEKGGNYDYLYGTPYLIKKDLIYFIHEISKDISSIDKNIIKEYSKNLYDLLDDELKKKLNTFYVYSVIRNNINKKNQNKIYKIDKNDFNKLDKYYRLGINNKLLKKQELNRIYNAYEVYYGSLESSELSPIIILKYEEFLNLQNEKNLEIEKKLSEIKTKYYSFELEKNLMDPSYKKNRENILSYYNFLKSNNYNFKKEQEDKIKTLNVKMSLEENIPTELKAYNFFPLFYYDDLCKLKTNLLDNKDKLCGYIKNLFPLYSISYDLFCSNDKTIKGANIDNETIDKTINFYCVVIFIIGIINYQLQKCNQDYMIILKGGKALQFILSEMNFKDDTILKSNDVDLIIVPVEGKKYNVDKCKFLAINICLLIQWILNTSNEVNNKNYYISHKIPFETDEYQFVIKLSQKIHNPNINTKFIAIADFDFNQIKEKVFYSDLINITKDTPLGKLTFIHQNIDYFLLEKIFYIKSYTEEIKKKYNLDEEKKENNYKYINDMKDKISQNYNNIKKYNEDIKQFKINIDEHKKKINENNKLLSTYYNKLYNLKIKIDEFMNSHYQYDMYYQNLLEDYNKTNYKYRLLENENKQIFKDQYTLEDYINDYKDKIIILNNDNNTYLTVIENIKEENQKILPNKFKNAKRFIQKFSTQVKSAIKIMTNNPTDSKEASLARQIEYIQKLILDNLKILKINTTEASAIIATIYPQ
jgi:hypothetical protein